MDKMKKDGTEIKDNWELVIDQKALWLRSPSEITDEEYQNFFKAVKKFTTGGSLTWVHFKAEGDVEFTALLFVPLTLRFISTRSSTRRVTTAEALCQTGLHL